MKNLEQVEISLDAQSREAEQVAEHPTDPEIYPDTNEQVDRQAAAYKVDLGHPELSALVKQARASTAALSGATGAFGLGGQVLDIPSFYANAWLQLSRIAKQYGFNPKRDDEARFMKKLLLIAHLPTAEAREKQLLEIHESDQPKTFASELGYIMASRASTISIYKLAAKAFAKRLKFMLPVVGAAANMASNLRLMECIIDTAIRGFARRASLAETLENPS